MTQQVPLEVVEVVYNWKGEITSYKRVNGDASVFIPVGNPDFGRLAENIANGEAIVQQPTITHATRTFSSDGTHTGYDTNVGFIPVDPNNPLYGLLSAAIEAGTCKESPITEIPTIDKSQHVTDVIVCVLFEQAWPHVKDNYRGTLCVRPNPHADVRSFSFCLRNVADPTSKSSLALLLEEHKCHLPSEILNGRHICTGVLEIEIPVRDILKIIRGVIREPDTDIESPVRDLFNMELVRSGRSSSEGPSSCWLVANAHLYLSSFISDFSNRVIEAFWQEYGGVQLAYVSPLFLQRQFLVLRKHKSGNTSVGTFVSSGSHSDTLTGEWWRFVGLDAVSDNPQYVVHPLRRALSRLRMLIETGFHMEAVVLVNGILALHRSVWKSEIMVS